MRIPTATIKSVLEDQDTKEIFLKGFYALIIKISGVGLGFLFTWFIARKYGAETNGIFSLCLTFFMLISILSRAGFDMSLTRFFSQSKSNNQLGKARSIFKKMLAFSFTLSLLLAIVFYWLAPFIAEGIFQSPALTTSFQYISLAIPAWTITMISAGALRGLGHSNAFTFYLNVGRFLFGSIFLFMVTFLMADTHSSLPAASYSASCILLAVISLIHIRIQTKGGSDDDEVDNLHYLLKISIPMLLSTSMFFVMGWLDRIVLGIFSTDTDVGIYHVTMKIATLTSFTLTSVNAVVAPKFAKHYYSGNFRQFNRVVKNSTLAIILGSVPIICLLLIFPEFILGIFGSEFTTASTVLFVLLAGQFVSVLSGSVGTILQMTGHQKIFQNALLLAVIFNVAGNFILCPIYGMMGAAIASLIAIATWNSIALYMVKKLTGVMTIYNPARLFGKE